MNILIVDTSYNKLIVVLKCENKVAYRVVSEGIKKNNSLVLPTIDALLSEQNIAIGDVDYYSCVVGPGSFTGVRIGVSTLNAFNEVFGKKLIAVTALEVLAYGVKADKIMASIDARHDNYYSAIFKGDYTHPVQYVCNTKADLDAFDGTLCVQSGDYDVNSLICVTEHKIECGEFVQQLKPLYMKESQAEREYAEKHKND